jgi:Spy/CpxP family protein refolding chaperone
MHPGFVWWWKSHHDRHHSCGPRAGWSGGGGGRGDWEQHTGDESRGGDGDGGGGFGVRRPLRFLAYRLNLSEAQVSQLARILNDLKTERAQASVDNRRAVAGFADAVGGDAFDETKAKAAAEDRVRSAGLLRDAVVKALKEIHGILQPGQREQLAYLIRTGALMM